MGTNIHNFINNNPDRADKNCKCQSLWGAEGVHGEGPTIKPIIIRYSTHNCLIM